MQPSTSSRTYYSRTGAEVYPVATILDPRFKLQLLPRQRVGREVDPGSHGRHSCNAFARYRAPPVHRRARDDANQMVTAAGNET